MEEYIVRLYPDDRVEIVLEGTLSYIGDEEYAEITCDTDRREVVAIRCELLARAVRDLSRDLPPLQEPERMPAEPSAEMKRLRDELTRHGVPFESDDYEQETPEGLMHVEVTSTGMHEVSYVWLRDLDGRKLGMSKGYPAYMELSGDSIPSSIVTVEEVLGMYGVQEQS